MKMKEVCERTGLTERTIRFYVEKGLLSPSCTFQNGREYRDYSPEDIQTLNRIAALRRAGFSIEEISSAKKDPSSVPAVASAWKERILQLTDHNQALLQACEKLDFSSMDFTALADSLEAASRHRNLPDTEVNFGRLDSESREEKERKTQKIKEKFAAAVSGGEKWIKLYILFSLIRDGAGIILYLVSGTFEFMDILGLGIDIMLFIFLYLGYNWSRIVLLIFSGLGIFLSVPNVFASLSYGVWWLSLTLALILLFNTALFLLLLLHRGIREYLNYEKSLR